MTRFDNDLIIYIPVMPLAAKAHPEFQLTLLQPGGPDYAHHITACPPGFENLVASLPTK